MKPHTTKREMIESLAAENPSWTAEQVAQQVGVSKYYAASVIELVRLRQKHHAEALARDGQPALDLGAVAIRCTPIELCRIFAETSRAVAVFARQVETGQEVESASIFARWLLGSGLLKVFESNRVLEAMPIDGKVLHKQTVALWESACEKLQRSKQWKNLEAVKTSEEALQERLAKMESLLEKIAA